jgi:hypothetical protein
MIQEVPDIEHKIHKCNGYKNLEPGWCRDKIKDSQVVVVNIVGGVNDSSGKDKIKDSTIYKGEDQIIDPAFQFGYTAGPIWNKKFKDQKKYQTTKKKDEAY